MATYPTNLARVVFGGSLPRGDAWSMSLWIHHEGDDVFDGNPLVHGGVRGAMSDAVSAWFRRPQSLISNNVRLQWMKANIVDTRGRYARPYTNEWPISPVTDGVAGGSQGLQWQHFSLAITHRTGYSRTAASTGRTYPPSITLFPNADGVADKAALQAYVNEYATMLNALRAAVPGEVSGTPLVVSTGTKAAPNVGVARPITSVEVGDVIDVQQRRRNAQPEEYTAATVAVTGGQAGGVTGGTTTGSPGA